MAYNTKTTYHTSRGVYTLTHTFTGWWVTHNNNSINIHPITTEGAALNLIFPSK